MEKFPKEDILRMKELLQDSPAFCTLNSMFREILDIDVWDALMYRETYGEFALMMLINSRITAKSKDPFLAAIEAFAGDREFMAQLSPQLRQMVFDALNIPRPTYA